MDTKNTPPGTGKFIPDKELVLLMASKVEDCNQVIHSNITKVTIVVEGKLKGERLYKYFYFTEDSIPPSIELKQFFLSYAARITNATLSLVEDDTKFIQLGNDVLSMDIFLKEYSHGLFPSINADDYIKVRDLELNKVAVIKINNSIQSIRRIK